LRTSAGNVRRAVERLRRIGLSGGGPFQPARRGSQKSGDVENLSRDSPDRGWKPGPTTEEVAWRCQNVGGACPAQLMRRRGIFRGAPGALDIESLGGNRWPRNWWNAAWSRTRLRLVRPDARQARQVEPRQPTMSRARFGREERDESARSPQGSAKTAPLHHWIHALGRSQTWG